MKKLFYLLCLSQFTMCDFKPAFSQVDPLEFPPGHPNVTIDPITQLQNFPAPRYKAGHTLMKNYNVMDPIYFGDYKQPGVSDNTAVDRSVAIQAVLCKDYNYYFNVNWFNNFYSQSCVNYCNAHPEVKIAAMTLRAQSGTKLWDQNFPNNHYLQNSSGQFMGWGGEIVTHPYKVWRPVATYINDYAVDGDVIRNAWTPSVANLNRNVDIVNEDGEVYPLLDAYPMDQDPVVNAARLQTGLPQREFLARMVRQNDNAYRNKFMVGKFAGAIFTEYRLDGHRGWQFPWSEARFINSPIRGQYYATSDLYVRWANNWKDWVSAWHGLRWVSESRHYELLSGDRLFSPFVAAGWSSNPEDDVRPAQWLGLMKVMSMYGTEFFYTSYFTESLPANNPRGYAWQAVIPPYSQAISSRYDDILLNGSLLPGDMINNQHADEWGTPTPIPMYQFSTGKTNYVVIVRKKDGVNKYAITGTIQNSSNQIGSAPLEDWCQIILNGEALKFKIRRHGSTYIYDKSVTPPVFYQLDGWHQYEHPWYWSKDFEIEAENFDASAGIIKTYNAAAPDYRTYQTLVLLTNNQTATYSFTARESGVKYLFVKASGGAQLECSIYATPQTVSVTNGWKKISLGNVLAANYTLLLKSFGNLEIDSISIASNPNKYPVTTCVPPSAVISPSNPDPCNGDTILLSASTGSSYQWSDSRTAQTISVFNNATYTVTVSNGNCSSVSAPYAVTFKTCSTCPAPENLMHTAPLYQSFTLSWTRVNTAKNGYTVYVKDITPGANWDSTYFRKQSVASVTTVSRNILKLKKNHLYEVYVVAQCLEMNSAKSIVLQIRTKGGAVAKLSTR